MERSHKIRVWTNAESNEQIVQEVGWGASKSAGNMRMIGVIMAVS